MCLPPPASKGRSQTKQSGRVCKQSQSSSAFRRQLAPSDRRSALPTVDRLFVCSRILLGLSAAGAAAAAGRLPLRSLPHPPILTQGRADRSAAHTGRHNRRHRMVSRCFWVVEPGNKLWLIDVFKRPRFRNASRYNKLGFVSYSKQP